LPGAVEIPDHWDGQGEDDEVHEDVEALVDDDEFLGVETFSWDAVVPVSAERSTLSCAGEKDSCTPGGD